MVIERMGFEKNKRFSKSYNNRGEWITIGDKTFHVDSQGEKRLAYHLETLKIGGYIKDWAREQTTFRSATGEPFWKVDFDVLNNDGTFEYWEFKGKMEQGVILKLELLMESRPEVCIKMIFESKSDAAKLAKRNAGQILLREGKIFIQDKNGKGLTEFDGKAPKKRRKPKFRI